MDLITSVEINFLVFRYLQESGFTHSAFVLGNEAGVTKSPIDGNLVPYGSLINIVQKGLRYLEMEANLSNNDADDEGFSFLQPMDLITKDVPELQLIVMERRRSLREDQAKEFGHDRKRKRGRDDRRQDKEKGPNTYGDRKGKKIWKKHDDKGGRRRNEKGGKERDGKAEIEGDENSISEKDEKSVNERVTDRDGESERDGKSGTEKDGESVKAKDGESGKEKDEKSGKEGGEKDGKKKIKISGKQRYGKIKPQNIQSDAEPVDVCSAMPSVDHEIPMSDVTILEGHSSEVFACAWSPSGSFLASVSGDSTARIWTVTDTGSRLHDGSANVVVLKHVSRITNEDSKDVTALDWNEEGTLLATGSYDGRARIWTTNGGLNSTLTGHKGAIFSMKWNKDNFLFTGGCDSTAIVWDVKREQPQQLFEYHSGPVLDVDWRNSVSFATCSTDHMIYVCEVGEHHPIKCFTGHQREVNCVKWDPSGTLLASGSDDSTTKIWNLEQDAYVHNLTDHSKEIYSIKWSPTGQGTNNPNQKLVLASASFDSTVKIWDAERGTLLQSLNGHRKPVYSIAFNPTGEYLASGSLDKSLHIWSLKEGKIVKTYSGTGSVFDVRWNKEGDKIGACLANNIICVLDFRM